jgi:hypothetical protein
MAKQIQPYERSSKLKFHEIVLNNFIGGISWGLGATVGLSIFFTLLTLIAKNVNLVPVVGSFVSDVINFILATNPNLHK